MNHADFETVRSCCSPSVLIRESAELLSNLKRLPDIPGTAGANYVTANHYHYSYPVWLMPLFLDFDEYIVYRMMM